MKRLSAFFSYLFCELRKICREFADLFSALFKTKFRTALGWENAAVFAAFSVFAPSVCALERAPGARAMRRTARPHTPFNIFAGALRPALQKVGI